jgi:hypothetical protein
MSESPGGPDNKFFDQEQSEAAVLMRDLSREIVRRNMGIDISTTIPAIESGYLSNDTNIMDVVKTPTFGDVAVIAAYSVDTFRNSRTVVTGVVKLSENDKKFNHPGKYDDLYLRALTWVTHDDEQTGPTDFGIRWEDIPLAKPTMCQNSDPGSLSTRKALAKEALAAYLGTPAEKKAVFTYKSADSLKI